MSLWSPCHFVCMLSLRQKGEQTKYGDILKFKYKNVFVEYCQIMLGDIKFT